MLLGNLQKHCTLLTGNSTNWTPLLLSNQVDQDKDCKGGAKEEELKGDEAMGDGGGMCTTLVGGSDKNKIDIATIK